MLDPSESQWTGGTEQRQDQWLDHGGTPKEARSCSPDCCSRESEGLSLDATTLFFTIQ